MVLRFGPFELDSETGELRRSGLVLRLPHQPTRLLLLFVRRAGEVVTREEIQQELWGSETHVDFEQGINAAIRQIRHHLGDNAEAPRYLKTIPRRGYVWIAVVEGAPPEAPAAIALPPPRNWRPILIASLILFVAMAAVFRLAQPKNRRTIAIVPFRALGALPPGTDPNVFTHELRATVGALPRKHLQLVEHSSNGDAQVRLEGTVQRDGDRVRVVVHCIDNISRTQLWTKTHERPIGQHADVAMQAAHHVAHEVAHCFLPPPRREPLLRTQVSPRVLELYRNARVEMLRTVPDANGDRALALFEEALRAEPRFAEAISGLADVWVQRSAMMAPPVRHQAAKLTRQYAQRALALQPGNVEAHNALGLLALQYDWDLAAAERHLRAAVKADPEYVFAQYNLSVVLVARGEFDAALEAFEQARALDPVDFDLHPVEGMMYLRARRYEEAIARYREMGRFRDSQPAWWGILWAAAKRRDWEEATAVLRPMLDLPPRPRGTAATEQEFCDLFARIEPIVLNGRERGTFDHFHVAAYYSLRGDLDRAFAALDRAIAVRSPGIAYVMVDPRFDAVRDDPRYARVQARVQ
ncbi:MAG TPA: winged helix-turn-helix domain-containing protein [Thermoanaerobaculia bacterium]